MGFKGRTAFVTGGSGEIGGAFPNNHPARRTLVFHQVFDHPLVGSGKGIFA
jgi:hypothetical protein